jgi:hypothetical protein
MEFTVIFLTKGRYKIYNSLRSIFKIADYDINLKLLIIDGNDDNRVTNLIADKFSKYKNCTKVIKQIKEGFMNGCFQSIDFVNTKFFTFMYDDDELSPYYGSLVKKSLKENRTFYAYGKVQNFFSKFTFVEPSIKFVDPKNILDRYFKFNISREYIPPNSPICSIFRTSILREWRVILQKYSQNDEYFDFYLMKKNIGPDLLLHLVSLTRENKKILYSKNYIAKFSSHENSMSIIYGNIYLGIGYFYTRVIFLKFFKKELIKKKKYIKFKKYIYFKIVYFVIRGNFYLNKIKKNTLNHLFNILKTIE